MRDPRWREIVALNPFLPSSYPRSLVRVLGVMGRDWPYDWELADRAGSLTHPTRTR